MGDSDPGDHADTLPLRREPQETGNRKPSTSQLLGRFYGQPNSHLFSSTPTMAPGAIRQPLRRVGKWIEIARLSGDSGHATSLPPLIHGCREPVEADAQFSIAGIDR